jgi:hypothetical protein
MTSNNAAALATYITGLGNFALGLLVCYVTNLTWRV